MGEAREGLEKDEQAIVECSQNGSITTQLGGLHAGNDHLTPAGHLADHCAGSHIYIKQWQTATDKQTDGCGVAAAAGG